MGIQKLNHIRSYTSLRRACLMSRLRAKEEALSRFRDNKGRVRWTSELSRPRLSLSRLRLSLNRPRLNKTREEKTRVTGKEFGAAMSRDRPKKSGKEFGAAMSRDRPKESSLGKIRPNCKAMSRPVLSRLKGYATSKLESLEAVESHEVMSRESQFLESDVMRRAC
jgi:hypothetical protein